MVRYLTLCENSVKLGGKGCKCVTTSRYSSTAVQISGSSLDGSEPCGMSGPNRLKRS